MKPMQGDMQMAIAVVAKVSWLYGNPKSEKTLDLWKHFPPELISSVPSFESY